MKVNIRAIARKVLNLVSAPKYYKGNSEQNKQGLQKKRVLKLKSIKESTSLYSNNKYKKEEEIIDRDGMIIIPNFFPSEILSKINSELEIFEKSNDCGYLPNKAGYGVDWHTGLPTSKSCPTIHSEFCKNDMIKSLVKHVTNKEVRFFPPVSFEKLNLPNGKSDNTDINRVVHADRYYPTIKAVLYLDDVVLENGPFHYSKGSHTLNSKRMKFEEMSSYYQGLIKEGRISEVPSSWLVNGRIAPPESEFPEYKAEPIIGKANTLAIINTCGFHYRGEMEPDYSRKSIRLVFHYVYSNQMAQTLLGLIDETLPGRYLN